MVRRAGAGSGSKTSKKGGRRRRTHHRKHRKGTGIWDDIKSGASKVNDFLKSSKIISTVGNALSNAPYVGPVAGTVGKVASSLGYGKRKKLRF